MNINKQLFASYARSAIGAALAVYMADPTNVNVRSVIAAGVAALIPPLMRWLNPNDKAFGRANPSES